MSSPYPQPSELFDLSSDVAVVTGGGRGIGEGIVKTLAAAGAAVVVAARRTEEIERVAKEVNDSGGRAVAITTDVTNNADLEAAAKRAHDEFGGLSIWVNNAGGSPVRRPMLKVDRNDWDECIRLNLTAVWEGIRVAARNMETGCILNVSSGAGSAPVPGSAHYGAAKAGVNSLTLTASAELAPRIRVNGIAPGVVPTEIFKIALGVETEEDLARVQEQWGIPLGRLGTPLDMGAAVLFLCSNAGSWISGETLRVAGGAKAR
ncbi:MAG: SDR family NAD(P)-dependent oxidoreductase [Ilumatobacteraceae bacterium]